MMATPDTPSCYDSLDPAAKRTFDAFGNDPETLDELVEQVVQGGVA